MAEKLNILVISYLYPNAEYPDYGIFVHNRMKAVSRKCSVRVINPVPWFPFHHLFSRYRNYDRIPKQEVMDGIEVLHPRFFIIPRYLKFLDCFTYAAAVLPLVWKFKAGSGRHRKRPVDIIDLHWTYPDLLAGLLSARWLKVPLLVTIRGKEALNLRNRVGRKRPIREYSIREMITNYLLKKADRVICLSRELADLGRGIGISPLKTEVVLNGVDGDRFCHHPKTEARKSLDLPPKGTLVLGVGGLTYGKGFDRIIKVMGRLKKNGRAPFDYHIIGSEGAAGHYKSELMKLARYHGVDAQVHFQGQIHNSQLPFWYNAVDLFCLTSRGEGCPNVLNEALACGCPCVATQVGAVIEMIDPGRQGEIVANGDEEMEQAILKALGTKYNRRANAAALKQSDWNSCARQVVGIYENLLKKMRFFS